MTQTSSQTQSHVHTKLAALRSQLVQHQLDAYLIPSADEHLNEYLPEFNQRRHWASGFSGSAGDFLLGREQAWMFVDSRYHEQAEQELDSASTQIVKVGLEGHKSLDETLEQLGQTARQAGQTFRLGYDPFTLAVNQWREFETKLVPSGITLVPIPQNLVDQVRAGSPWNQTADPAYASSPLFRVPDELAGEPVEAKLKRLREKLAAANADILPITKLDQIAWLFNLRGWDVAYNPVFISYAIATAKSVYLFTNLNRIDAELQQQLSQQVNLLLYHEYAPTLRSLLTQTSRVLIDPKHTTMGTVELLKNAQGKRLCPIVYANTPIEGMKARKNATEIAQMQQANLKASRAKTRTMKWVFDQLAAHQAISEADVAATVEEYYAEETGFQGLSFNTIAGSGANSSIVHYGTPNPAALLQSGDLLLLDSGAQYAAGTTDDTRTLAIGTPTPEQIERYTEVLKAHINCAMQKFPKGTTGAQLDGITRATLWHLELDFGHGVGHGVGAFLNVHEGPNGISKRVSEPLEPGMVTSIEPGFYQPGWGGIRLENLYLVREVNSAPDAPALSSPEATQASRGKPTQTPWYCFESLTYIPFDPRLLDLNRLDSRQRAWLEAYYRQIVEKLTPTLDAAEIEWLHRICTI
jgi:Xaa-Pro aminopeptidase